ncbi:MAG: TPM domain-containing protein [Clostridia bacterium]|nr:TPM domain-containing protein [Clostridia bacterium]
MKKFIVFLLATLVLCTPFMTVSAESNYPRLIDGADLLTPDEEAEILVRLNATSEEFEYDVVIVTAETFGFVSPYNFAVTMFQQGNYGMGENKSGVILVVSEKERKYYIEFFGDSKLPEGTAMEEYFIEYLRVNDYYGGLYAFAEAANDELSFSIGTNLLIWLAVGLVVALIVTSVMKGQLKSVRFNDTAREYVRPNSFNLEHSRDLYLYSTVSRVAKPKQSSSSSGRSGGGGGSRGGGGSF